MCPSFKLEENISKVKRVIFNLYEEYVQNYEISMHGEGSIPGSLINLMMISMSIYSQGSGTSELSRS